jgi:23S rRNA (uracil1939-C5)-methyltransferase
MPQNTRAKAQVTEFDNGVELHISLSDMTLADLSMQQIEAITSCVAKGGLIRVTLNDEVVLAVEEPLVKFGSVAVNPPSGAFLQPCKLSEIELQKSVVEVVSKRCSAGDLIADLFCGCGTFTFPLASNFKVDAYDSDAEQIQAMQRAITAQPSVNRVTPTKRDLFERPLIGKELESLACAVLDPPRAGARFQVEHLALAGVPLIVYVSCNLASFARDCRTLVDHGYRLENVTPIDQFKYSAHLECIGVLSLAAENHP